MQSVSNIYLNCQDVPSHKIQDGLLLVAFGDTQLSKGFDKMIKDEIKEEKSEL